MRHRIVAARPGAGACLVAMALFWIIMTIAASATDVRASARPMRFVHLSADNGLSQSNDGVWSDRELAIPVDVEVPPWRRWWVYALFALGFGGVLFGVFWSQRRELVLASKYRVRLEHEVQIRTRELAERNVDLEDVNTQLRNASLTDPLTGLRNRRFLFEQFVTDFTLAKRRAREAAAGDAPETLDIAFMMVDLDLFKPINDEWGHKTGDRVLMQAVKILTAACRESDVLIRWGGDEFLLVGRDTDSCRAASLAERIRAEIANHRFDVGHGQTAAMTCSIGFASFPFVVSDPDAVSWEEVVLIADHALYAAKARRDAWVGFYEGRHTPRSIAARVVADTPLNLEAEGALSIVSSFDLRRFRAAS